MGEMINRARLGAGRAWPGGVWAERSWPPAQGTAEQAVAGVDADVMLDELARASDAPTQAEKRRAKALKQTGAGPDSASQLALNELTNGKPDTALVLMERAAVRSVVRRARSCCICLN